MTRRRAWAPSMEMPSDRYALHVLGRDQLDVVSMIGGWLFDRAMAGWDVTAFATEPTETRPLQILGCRVLPLEVSCLTTEPLVHPPVLAVSANLYCNDTGVRSMVLAALEHGSTVVTWGDESTHELDCASPALSVLSRAAAVFKGHALRAAGAPESWPHQLEEFRAIVPAGARSGWRPASPLVLQQLSSLGGMQ